MRRPAPFRTAEMVFARILKPAHSDHWLMYSMPSSVRFSNDTELLLMTSHRRLAARGGSGRFGGGQKSVVYGLGERTGLLQVLKVTC